MWTKIGAKCDEWTETTRYLDGSMSRERLRWHEDSVEIWMDS